MPIAIVVAYTMFSDVAVQSLVILPYTSIESSKNDELLGSHSSAKRVKFLIEFVLDFFWLGHGRSSGLFTQGTCMVIRRSLIPFVMLTSSFTRLDLTAKPTPASRLSSLLRPLQKKV